ncbi:PIG-L family deacetylase [Actinomadura sp. DC4]|uniref:PIG-L family deacetylase n=1 Tax=Actinomadura sp. DC4 TaxID=3055069 RepID=UPI0025B2423C|nr:PIG-L family deacetylase [Actinomadura sp. DC4]MDN3358268.1 PIG-L family deacetylase [Actinomadura sp. DC4]
MTAETGMRPSSGAHEPGGAGTALPEARSVLAVVARPGDEACYLGAVLDAFRRGGSQVSVLAFSRGDESPYNDSMEQLEVIRPFELDRAASALRAVHCLLADYPEAEMRRLPTAQLAERVIRMIGEWSVDLILTVDGRVVDRTAACVACQAGREAAVPVLGWTLPHEVAKVVREATGLSVTGDAGTRIDFELRVARTIQRYAMSAHVSQAGGCGTQLARLEVQGDREWLRWLVPAVAEAAPAKGRRRP